MKLYHGTSRIFSQFDLTHGRNRFNNYHYAGLFVTPNLAEAENWTDFPAKFWSHILSFDLDDKHILPGNKLVKELVTESELEKIFFNIVAEAQECSLPESLISSSLDKFRAIFKLDGKIVSDSGSRENLNLRDAIRDLLEPPGHFGLRPDIPERSKYIASKDAKCRVADAAAVMLLELGYHALHDFHEPEVIVYDFSQVSEVRLEKASKTILEDKNLKLGQVMIGAGNQPVDRALAAQAVIDAERVQLTPKPSAPKRVRTSTESFGRRPAL
jgi:hypothetical protein